MTFAAIDEFFLSDKKLASVIPSYKLRQEQLDMAYLVQMALQEKNTLLVEAGTGVGKTLAYLVPALLFASDEKKKVVISTHTIALQDQIQAMNVPLVKNLLGLDIRSLSVLGMSNYLCLHKLDEKRDQNSLFRQKDPRFESMQTRANQGMGTKKNLASELLPIWHEVAATKEDCLVSECEFFKDCFFYRNRKEAQDAQVLIVNHHLLLIDLLIKQQRDDKSGLFPHYDALIVDEAHHLETVAKKQLSFEISIKSLAKEINALKSGDQQAKKLVLDKANHFFIQLDKTHFSRNAGKLLHAADLEEKIFQEEVVPALQELQTALHALEIALTEKKQENEYLGDFGQLRANFEALAKAFTAFNPQENALWVEKRPDTTLVFSRPEMGPLLKELLFKQKIPQVFSSATLSVKGNFTFFKKSVGLAENVAVSEKILLSPYNYAERVFFALASDLPSPEEKAFNERANAAIYECIKASGGKTFVLFTSYEALFAAKKDLEAKLAALGMELICQTDMDTHEMVKTIRQKEKIVLFGTDTFWEGVDVKGLKLIILTKLPFASPSDPRQEALGLVLAAQGKNLFMESMLPQAAIKFKQGFGRLMRSENDYGAIICLDKRLKEKNYGKTFLQSLPEITLHIDSVKNTAKNLARFLERSGIEPLTSTMPLLRSTN